MKDFIRLLDKTTSLTHELLYALGEERAALSEQDTTILETAIEKKLATAQALQPMEQQRDAALAKQGLTPGLAGLQAFLANHTDQKLHDSWQALCEASQRCKEENLLVGTMIRKNQLVTEQALQVLRRGSIETVQTYSANGTPPRQSLSSPLGKA